MLEFIKTLINFLKRIIGIDNSQVGPILPLTLQKKIVSIPPPVITPVIPTSVPSVNPRISNPTISSLTKPPKYFKDVVARYGTPYDPKTQKEDEAIKLEWEHEWMDLWTAKGFTKNTGIIWPATGPFKKIYCNKDLIPYLDKVFVRLIEKDLFKELKTFDGCWNIRPIRGTTDKWSMHTWAIAIDINAEDNKLGEVGKLSQEFLQCWRDTGWTCGADFERRDFMHFQLPERA